MAVDAALFFSLHSLAHQSILFDTGVVFFAESFPYLVIAGAVITISCLRISLKDRLRLLVLVAVSGLLARFFFTEIIYFLYHRPRPFLIFPIHPLFIVDEWSFPSGHAAFYFAVALALLFTGCRWGIWFLFAAILIGLARIISGVHYPSDILGGAVLGGVTAWIIVRLAKNAGLKHTRNSRDVL